MLRAVLAGSGLAFRLLLYDEHEWRRYSARRAFGFTRVARRAGTQNDKAAIAVSNAAPAM